MSSVFQTKVSNRIRASVVNNPYFGLPYTVQIEVTTKCNLRCDICIRNNAQSDAMNRDMPFDLYSSIISGLRYPTRFINLVGLGEPLLNPQIFLMIELAKKKGFEVSLIDNFTLIDKDVSLSLIKSKLDYLFVSFDSTSKKTFERMRTGASFEKVVENVKLFVETKKKMNAKKPNFLFKATISRENFAEIPQFIKLAEDLGVDGVNFGKLCAKDEDYVNDLSISLDSKDVSPSKTEIYPCELSKTFSCSAPRGCYVTFDGKVLPCGLLLEIIPRNDYSKFQLGDANLNAIERIWRSAKYRRFRREIAAGKFLPLCKKCPAWRQT